MIRLLWFAILMSGTAMVHALPPNTHKVTTTNSYGLIFEYYERMPAVFSPQMQELLDREAEYSKTTLGTKLNFDYYWHTFLIKTTMVKADIVDTVMDPRSKTGFSPEFIGAGLGVLCAVILLKRRVGRSYQQR